MPLLGSPGGRFLGACLGLLAGGVLILAAYMAWDAWPWLWVRWLRSRRTR